MSRTDAVALAVIAAVIVLVTALAAVLVGTYNLDAQLFPTATPRISLPTFVLRPTSDDPTPDRFATAAAHLDLPTLPPFATPVALDVPVATPAASPLPTQPALRLPLTPGVPAKPQAAAPALTALDGPPFVGPLATGPEPFTIFGLTTVRTGKADWFFGEVRNDTAASRSNIAVRVVTFDAAGNELRTSHGYADRDYLRPGETAPFAVLLTEGNTAPFASIQLEVRASADTAFAEGYALRGLQPEPAISTTVSNGAWSIAGWAVNREPQPVAFPELTIVFYNAQGAVVGVGQTFAETDSSQALAPGARARFALSWPIFSDLPVGYRVIGQASRKT